MPRPQLIETMRKLFLDGLITAHRADVLDEEFVFTKEQLDAALNETRDDKPHYYSLTHKGGQYWEAFASPNWNRYIDVGYQPDDKFDI